jgi:hypothetical protein
MMDDLKGLLIVLAVFAVPLVGIGIVVATDQPQSQPQAVAPVAPVLPPAPAAPDRPVPPLHSAEACQWGAPPQPGLMAECERRRLDRLTRETLRDTERFRGLRPGGPSWSPRSPSSPRPIPPSPAWPGDPNDRDHDGRACESGCIN